MTSTNTTTEPTPEGIAAELEGSAMTLDEVLGQEWEHLEDCQNFTTKLDTLVFRCEICCWWSGRANLTDVENWACDECVALSDDEDSP